MCKPTETRCVVTCHNASGEPDFFATTVSVTQAEYDLGKHYDFAKTEAMENDYEGHMIVFDENEMPDWLFAQFFNEPAQVKTEDGYKFVRQEDGSYTDGDMTFDSLLQLAANVSVAPREDKPSDDLTADQVAALTHSWLDMKASFNFLQEIEDLLDRCEIPELTEALSKSIMEIEQTFPFLLDEPHPDKEASDV